MFLIFCDGGFANRVNSLISGMALARLLGRPHMVLWPVNNRCGAAFETVFRPTHTAMPVRLQDMVPYEGTLRPWLHENDVGFTQAYLGLRGLSGIDALAALAGADSRPILFAENMVLPWLPPELVADCLNRLELSPQIVGSAQRILGGRAPGSYFGIHLRGTDFTVPPPVAPMLDLVGNNAEHSFFVCSDDKQIEQQFAGRANVFVHDKSAHVGKLTDGPWRHDVVDSDGLPYTSNIDRTADSVIQACADLLVLAASVPIRTSHSSFLALAERMRESGFAARHLLATP